MSGWICNFTPAEHWLHLRTGNVIESPFATVRLRQRVAKGAGSRQKGLLMAFQLLAMAERRWRRMRALQLVPPVRAGVIFRDGVAFERVARTRRAAWAGKRRARLRAAALLAHPSLAVGGCRIPAGPGRRW